MLVIITYGCEVAFVWLRLQDAARRTAAPVRSAFEPITTLRTTRKVEPLASIEGWTPDVQIDYRDDTGAPQP